MDKKNFFTTNILQKIWKAEGWPQLYFYPPQFHKYLKDTKYDQVVSVGNSQADILVPYEINTNRLTLPGNEYIISFIKTVENYAYPFHSHEMEWIGNDGSKIYFRELSRGESKVPLYKVKIPF